MQNKITHSEAVLCYCAFVVLSCLPFCCCNIAKKMDSVQCSNSIFEKWIELWILLDFGWKWCVCIQKPTMVSVEWRWQERKKIIAQKYLHSNWFNNVNELKAGILWYCVCWILETFNCMPEGYPDHTDVKKNWEFLLQHHMFRRTLTTICETPNQTPKHVFVDSKFILNPLRVIIQQFTHPACTCKGGGLVKGFFIKRFKM